MYSTHFLILPHSILIPYSPLPPYPEEKYGREVRIIPVDFSDGPEIYPRIAEELQDLDIGLLGKLRYFSSNSLTLLCGVTHSTLFCVFSKQCRVWPAVSRILW